MIDILVTVTKLLASVFLVTLLVTALLKADPKRHNPKYPAMAEYGAGFIASALACLGLYWLWLA